MKESIKMEVNVFEKEGELEFENSDDNVITLKLNGKIICGFDYEGNFKRINERIMEIWGDING